MLAVGGLTLPPLPTNTTVFSVKAVQIYVKYMNLPNFYAVIFELFLEFSVKSLVFNTIIITCHL